MSRKSLKKSMAISGQILLMVHLLKQLRMKTTELKTIIYLRKGFISKKSEVVIQSGQKQKKKNYCYVKLA